MELLVYILIAILAYSGIIFGWVIILFAPEEKIPGRRYFQMLCHTLFFGCVLLSFFWFKGMFLLLPILCGAAYFFLKEYRHHLSYFFFSLLFFPFSANLSFFLALSSLIFAYGLSAGPMLCNLKKKMVSFGQVLQYSYFLLVCILLKIVL